MSRIRNHVQPGGLIFCYHRVAPLERDPTGLNVSAPHFVEHLEVLRRLGCPVRLQEIVRMLETGRSPRRAFAVTFDDGYEDCLTRVAPLLARHDIPATFFVPTGEGGRSIEFLWDALDRLLLEPGVLPVELELSVNGHKRAWRLRQTDYPPEEERRNRRWNFRLPPSEDPSERHRLYREIRSVLLALPPCEQQAALRQLLHRAGIDAAVRPTHRALSFERIEELSRSAPVEVGAHTVSHPMLALLPPAAQREEIERNMRDLERITGRPARSLAYPFGSWTRETVEIARDAGLACACTVVGRVVRAGANPFELPRAMIGDMDGASFERLVRRFVA